MCSELFTASSPPHHQWSSWVALYLVANHLSLPVESTNINMYEYSEVITIKESILIFTSLQINFLNNNKSDKIKEIEIQR